ncbi:MAG TPA: plastocyanin/azurin family copper-binding protein [Candidatus Nitrosotenuis sp.]|jgi:plastocyanin
MILILSVVVIILAGVIVTISLESNVTESDNFMADQRTVLITVSSSRPGCEATNTCYVPAEITASSGEIITWVNEDSAFHTVTSGYYDTYDGIFDSGQLDPAEKFSYSFDETGSFHYYCKLHPWMEGMVVVK